MFIDAMRHENMRRGKELISILIVTVFLASVFLSMVQGTDNVHLENTFDAKLINRAQ